MELNTSLPANTVTKSEKLMTEAKTPAIRPLKKADLDQGGDQCMRR